MHENLEGLPNGYKMTELGPLPEDWQMVRLGELACVRYGKAKPSTTGTIPVIGSGGVYSWSDKPLIQFPTLIIGRKGTAGQVWLSEKMCWPADTTFYLEWKQTIDVHFLHAWLILHPLSGEHAKTTLPSLQRPDVENLLLPCPPVEEQRAIAYVLRTVQQAKEAAEKVIAAARELKRSLMRHLFTYGSVPVEQADQVRLKDTELGPLPEHWRVVRLGEVVQKTKLLDPRKQPDRHFKYIDVSSISNESLAIVDHKIYFGKEAPSRARKQIHYGDVIFATVRPYLKRIAKIPIEFDGHVCSTAFCVLHPITKLLDGNYLFFAVSRDQFVEKVSEHQRGSSYPAVTDNDVLKELLPLPPLEEQREIARILHAVDEKIRTEETRKTALEALFKTLLHHLMTAKTRLPSALVAEHGGEKQL